MGTRLRVDTRSLRRMAEDLRAVREALDSPVPPAADALGERSLVRAVQDAAQGWHRRRARLCSDLEQMARLAEAAADRFEAADADLGRAVAIGHP